MNFLTTCDLSLVYITEYQISFARSLSQIIPYIRFDLQSLYSAICVANRTKTPFEIDSLRKASVITSNACVEMMKAFKSERKFDSDGKCNLGESDLMAMLVVVMLLLKPLLDQVRMPLTCIMLQMKVLFIMEILFYLIVVSFIIIMLVTLPELSLQMVTFHPYKELFMDYNS